ncbi:hypothetical protein [Paenibacillus sp. CMAA1364]
MMMMKRVHVLFFTLLLCMCVPVSAAAGSLELTTTTQSKFDTMVASAQGSTGSMMRNRYAHILNLQQQAEEWNHKIKIVQYQNEEALIILKKQIQLLDFNKITTLQNQLTQARDRYTPLFSMYESLQRQKAIAKKLTHKDLYQLLHSQSEGMKIAVQLARTDIRNKESQFTTAKRLSTATKKKLRELLDPTTPLRVHIKVAKNAASTSQKKMVAEISTLKKYIHNNSVSHTVSFLETLYTHAQSVFTHKQKVLALEEQISHIIKNTGSQIPAQK